MARQKKTRHRISVSPETYDRLDQLSKAFWMIPIPLVVAELARMPAADFQSMMAQRVADAKYGPGEPQAGPTTGPAKVSAAVKTHAAHMGSS